MKLLIKHCAFNAIIAALVRPALEQQIINVQHAILLNKELWNQEHANAIIDILMMEQMKYALVNTYFLKKVLACHISCLTCDNSGINDCLTCDSDNHVIYKSVEDEC